MYEYDIVRVTRRKETKTKEVTNKKGRTESQAYTEVETFEEFDTRAKNILNDMACDGWQVMSVNYSLPIQGAVQYALNAIKWVSFSTTDFDSAEFIAVMQRSK